MDLKEVDRQKRKKTRRVKRNDTVCQKYSQDYW